MGCISSKQDKSKELVVNQVKKEQTNGKEHSQPDQNQNLKLDNQDNLTKHTLENKNENKMAQPTETYSNQMNGLNNQSPNKDYQQQEIIGQNNRQDNSQSLASQTEVIKVSGQKDTSKKNEGGIQGSGSKSTNNKNFKSGVNVQKNQQSGNKKKSMGHDGQDADECNVDDVDEGVQANQINAGECNRGVKLGVNKGEPSQQVKHQAPHKGQQGNVPLKQNEQKTTQNTNQVQNQNIAQDNGNPYSTQSAAFTQQKESVQGAAKVIQQQQPKEIKKLDEEQEQKALEQYEKLMQNQQQKVVPVQFQVVDEKSLSNNIQQAISQLDWKQALYLNTSLLRIYLDKLSSNKSSTIQEGMKNTLMKQIDLLWRNGLYDQANSYASNYLEENSEYGAYVSANYLYLNSKYQEAFTQINVCLQSCFTNNFNIKPEYIICAGNCMIEIFDPKFISNYLDQLPIKSCQALNTPENLNAVAEQYLRIKKNDQAKDILKLVINAQKDNLEAQINMGNAFFQEDSKKAKQHFNRALEIVQTKQASKENSVCIEYLQYMINSC